MSNLASFLSDQAISQKAFADRVGVDKSIVSRLARREMKPSLDLAFAIERETGGAVPASSWVVEPEDQKGAA